MVDAGESQRDLVDARYRAHGIRNVQMHASISQVGCRVGSDHDDGDRKTKQQMLHNPDLPLLLSDWSVWSGLFASLCLALSGPYRCLLSVSVRSCPVLFRLVSPALTCPVVLSCLGRLSVTRPETAWVGDGVENGFDGDRGWGVGVKMDGTWDSGVLSDGSWESTLVTGKYKVGLRSCYAEWSMPYVLVMS